MRRFGPFTCQKYFATVLVIWFNLMHTYNRPIISRVSHDAKRFVASNRDWLMRVASYFCGIITTTNIQKCSVTGVNINNNNNNNNKARLLAASSPHTDDWLHAPPIASVGLRLSDEAVWHTDWAARPVNHTLVCVVKQSVHEVSMAWHVADVAVVQDISVTANSTTSRGGYLRELRFQLWRSLQAWVVTMASVQMVSRCCPGQKAKTIGMGCHSTRHLCRLPPRWHGDHSTGGSWQGGRQRGGQIQTADQQPHLCTSCHWVSRDLEPPSSGVSAGVGPTNDSRH